MKHARPLICVLLLAGCGARTTVIEIVDHTRDANSDVWVCEGWDAQTCRGEAEGDIDPEGWQRRVKVATPPSSPEGCAHGAAAIHVVLEGDSVTRVRYECAAPSTTTPLPPPSGLPED